MPLVGGRHARAISFLSFDLPCYDGQMHKWRVPAEQAMSSQIIILRAVESLYNLDIPSLGDALGSVRQLADLSPAVTLARSFEPFGDTLASAGPGVTAFQFTGEQTDQTALVYLRSRYYTPRVGRFTTMDVWQGDPGRPQSLNPWNYVEGNPINRTDPSGMCFDEDGDGKCDVIMKCSVISDPEARRICWLAQCAEPILPPPSGTCNPDCMDAYRTLVAVVDQLGEIPSLGDLLFMTAATEYFAYVDSSYYNSGGYVDRTHTQQYPHPAPREVGREALGRAYYHFCGQNPSHSEGMPLYRFLSGYQPWTGYKGEDHGDPQLRATHLVNEGLVNGVSGTAPILRKDIDLILSGNGGFSGGIGGGDRPWQWFTTGERFPLARETFGFSRTDNRAILAVDAGGGKYLWMVTYLQDELYW